LNETTRVHHAARRRSVGVLIATAAEDPDSQGVLLSELALKHRLPTMFATKENVVAGGLMSYAPNHIDLSRRAASYIDKIIKGARPADLPVEQASKYQLVINLRTAQALGLNPRRRGDRVMLHLLTTGCGTQRPWRHSSNMSAVERKPAVPSRCRDFSV
jgi:ABC-type uncharacterized transport system substrate-binding protein